MTEPEKDNRTPAEKKAEIRHSIIGLTVFITGTAILFAVMDVFIMQ